MEYQKLFRSRTNKVFAGVAGGLGEFFGFKPVIVRILFFVLAIMGGGGVLIYILLWIIVPYKEFDFPSGFSSSSSSGSGSGYGNGSSSTDSGAKSEPEHVEAVTINEQKDWHYHYSSSKGSVIGALILITLGILFLADSFTNIEFSKLWPVLLVIIGIYLLFGRGSDKKQDRHDRY